METLHIHAEKLTTKHYIGLFVSIITVTLAFVSYFNSQLSAISVCIMVVLVAVVLLLMIKVINTPCISFTLTFMHCQYHSRYGGWTTTWHNIAHIGHATLGSQGWHSSLPWIGIRLKNYDAFIRNICPRVASRILLEQRILLIMASKFEDYKQCLQIECVIIEHYLGLIFLLLTMLLIAPLPILSVYYAAIKPQLKVATNL